MIDPEVSASRFLAGPGWKVASQVLAGLVKDAESAVLACEDDAQLARLQHEARAMRKMVEEFERRMKVTAKPEGYDAAMLCV